MQQIMRFIILVLALSLSSCEKENGDSNNDGNGNGTAPLPGVFPLWEEGYLDIHAINTGRGECTFMIWPDGTTMLIDAGDVPNSPPTYVARPNDSRSPGEWIARYIRHMLQDFPEKKLDYIVVSHFHWDHLGNYNTSLPLSSSGTFRLSGITEVAEHIPFGKIIDNNWPDYNWPIPLDFGGRIDNYRAFIDWHMQRNQSVAEQFVVGTNQQLVLLNKPEQFPEFEIRNIASNGVVWSGEGDGTENHFPGLEYLLENEYSYINTGGFENNASVAFLLSYGDFSYFTGGDISFRGAHTGGTQDQWKNIELPVGQATGRVDVMKANHHGAWDANSTAFLSSLRPRVIVIHTVRNNQPSPQGTERMVSTQTYPGPRDLFATQVLPEARAEIGQHIGSFSSTQGHVVVRVDPGGETYHVYVLNDSDERFMVQEKFGPYATN